MKTSKQYHHYLKRNKILKKFREDEKQFKKLKRKIYYEVYYSDPEQSGKLTEKDFCSVGKARTFVKKLYNKYPSHRLDIEIVKVWVYRWYHPRHKTTYNYEPCGDKWIKIESF